MGNPFLYLAYGFLLLVFILYGWNLSRRQAHLREDLDELKARVLDQSPPDPRLP